MCQTGAKATGTKAAAARSNVTNQGQQDPNNNSSAFACKHYKRKCKFVAPCCDKVYQCRFCHDEVEDHNLDGFAVSEVICSACNRRQPIRSTCENCGILFGAYSCLKCKLFDDEVSRVQFHCDGCGICRVGNKDDYFHCDKCDMCLPLHMADGNHNCIESVSRKDCPICLEDIHTSREPSQIPPCHHLIHKSCFRKLISSGSFRCPTCLKSITKMHWHEYDFILANNPMPKEYAGVQTSVKCFDCDYNGRADYHFFSLRCKMCGGHNTARGLGPLFKVIDGEEVEFVLDEEAGPESANTSPSAASYPPAATSGGDRSDRRQEGVTNSSDTPSDAPSRPETDSSSSDDDDDDTESWALLEHLATGECGGGGSCCDDDDDAAAAETAALINAEE